MAAVGGYHSWDQNDFADCGSITDGLVRSLAERDLDRCAGGIDEVYRVSSWVQEAVVREGVLGVTTADRPFEIGQDEALRDANGLAIIACGPLMYQALLAAEHLHSAGLDRRARGGVFSASSTSSVRR